MFGDLFSKEESLHIDYPLIGEYDLKTKLKKEKEALGVYISAHPLDEYIDLMQTFTFNSSMIKEAESSSSEVEDYESSDSGSTLMEWDGQNVTFGGIIAEIQKRVSKTTQLPMAILRVEDMYGTVDVMLFNKLYEKVKNDLQEDSMAIVKGRVSIREGQNPIIICDTVEIVDDKNKVDLQTEKKKLVFGEDNKTVQKKMPKLYLKFDLANEDLKNEVCSLLSVYPGEVQVLVQYNQKLYSIGIKAATSPACLAELSSLIGSNNIKVI